MTSSQLLHYKELHRQLEAARIAGNMSAMQEILGSLTLLLRATYG